MHWLVTPGSRNDIRDLQYIESQALLSNVSNVSNEREIEMVERWPSHLDEVTEGLLASSVNHNAPLGDQHSEVETGISACVEWSLLSGIRSAIKERLYCATGATFFSAVMSGVAKVDHCDLPGFSIASWIASYMWMATFSSDLQRKVDNGQYNHIYERPFTDRWMMKSEMNQRIMIPFFMVALSGLTTLMIDGLPRMALDIPPPGRECSESDFPLHLIIGSPIVGLGLLIVIELAMCLFEPCLKSQLMNAHQAFNQKLQDVYREPVEELDGLIEVPLLEGSRQPHLTERYIAQQLIQGNVSGLFTQACSKGRVDVVKYCLQHEWPFVRAWKNEVVRSERISDGVATALHLKIQLASLPLMFQENSTGLVSGGKKIFPTQNDVMDVALRGRWPVVAQLLPFQSSNPHSLQQQMPVLVWRAFESAPINTLSLILDELTSTGSTWGVRDEPLFDGLRRAAFRGRLDALNFTLSYYSETDGSNVPPSYQKIWQAAFAGDLASLDAAFGMGYEEEDERLKVVPVCLAATQKHDECVRRALLDLATFSSVMGDQRIITQQAYDDKGVRECVLKVLCEMIVQQALSPNQLHRLYADNEEGRLGGVEQVKNAFLQLTSERYIAMHRRYTILTSQGIALDPIKSIEHYLFDPLAEELKVSGTDEMLNRLSLQGKYSISWVFMIIIFSKSVYFLVTYTLLVCSRVVVQSNFSWC